MISKCIYKNITWIDLESPTRQEIESIKESLDIPDLVATELHAPAFRSKINRYGKCVYLILHFPVFSKKAGKVLSQEVDFIIGADFVITTHYEPINAISEFAKLFEINSALDRGVELPHAGFLFFYIIQEIYHSLGVELDSISDSIQDIEHNIFSGKESQMVGVISAANRTLVDFKQTIRSHSETLASLESAGAEFFGKDFLYQLNVISGEYRKTQKTIDDYKEILRDLRETNDSLLTAKTNDIITKLTIMNFIMLPLGLITWTFAMDVGGPLLPDMQDFLIVIGAMALTGIVMIIYFKNKKWL